MNNFKSWKNTTVLKTLEHLKEKYPTKEVVMTETGVQDKWCALSKPEKFDWEENTVNTGIVQSIYLYGLLVNTNVDYIDSVWWWYNFIDKDGYTSKLTRYMLKGEKYE